MSSSRPASELEQIVSFADALPVAVWVGEAPSGRCVYVNREFERMLGITPPPEAERGNYVGPYGVHLPNGEKYPEDRMPYEQAMRAGAPVVIEDVVIHRHDGSKMSLRVFASPLRDASGKITHIVEAFTDKTREVENERQLLLAKRLESVGAFAGGIAHDLNNLLGVVSLVAGNLRKHETNPQRQELIAQLEGVAASATKLTTSLLSLARTGQSGAPRTLVSVREVAENAVKIVRPTLEGRIDVSLRFVPENPSVRADASQLERVIINLLTNARDAIAVKGSVLIGARVEKLSGHAILKDGDYVVIDVKDSGPGIDPSVRDRVFEPFVTTKAGGALRGSGMGLAGVYAIARAHDGLVEVAETGPSGTTMRVYLAAAT